GPERATDAPVQDARPDAAVEADLDRYVADDAPNPVGVLSRISVRDAEAGIGRSDMPSVSADGRLIVFESLSWIFMHDRQAGTTTVASVEPGTHAPLQGISGQPRISADGVSLVFITSAPSLVNALPASVIWQPIGFDAVRMTSFQR